MNAAVTHEFAYPIPIRAGLLFAVVGAHLLVALVLWSFAPPRDVASVSQVLAVEWITPYTSVEPAPVTPPQPQAKPEPRPVSQPVKAVPAAMPVPSAEPAVTSEAAPAQAQPAESAPAPQAEAAPAVEPPRFDAAYLRNPPPPYPAVSRRMGEEGRVLLRVQVSEEGRALQVEINQSSGSARLDRAALLAVRDWRFVPAQQGGRGVPAWVIVPISFSLKD